MKEYTKKEIAEILNKRVRTITFWTDSGLVVPEIQPSDGKGVRRRFSERNLIEFAMISIMVDMKLNLKAIKHIFKTLRGENENIPNDGKMKLELKRFFVDHDFGVKKDIKYAEEYYEDEDGVSGPVTWFHLIEYDWDDEIAPGIPNEKQLFPEGFSSIPGVIFKPIIHENSLYLGRIKNIVLLALEKMGKE